MRIIDFIAGMTDSYATQMAREMTGRSSPAWKDPPFSSRAGNCTRGKANLTTRGLHLAISIQTTPLNIATLNKQYVETLQDDQIIALIVFNRRAQHH